MVNDRRIGISVNWLVAWAFWAIGLGLILVDMFSRWPVGELGVYLTAGAAVLSVRGFLCAMSVREQTAFRIGQDSVRALR